MGVGVADGITWKRGGRAEHTSSSDEAEVMRHRRVVDDSVCDHDEDGCDERLVSSVRFQESHRDGFG